MRPRIESWQNVASHLRRFVKPSLGKMIASDATRHDIAALSNDILDGKYGVASVSNARHMRRAVSGLYCWAAEAGRDFVPETCRLVQLAAAARRACARASAERGGDQEVLARTRPRRPAV